MGDLPSGTLTFLFTDLEGSTALWESQPDVMREAVARHDELLAEAVTDNGGQVVKTTGDGMVAVFVNATDSLSAALGCQQSLGAEDWPVPIKARMGLYTGEAEAVDGDYHSPVLNRAARVMDAGHGGQVLVSASTAGVVGGGLPAGAELVDLGEHRLRDLGQPESLFQLCHPDLDREFPPLRTIDAFPGNLPLQVTSFVGRDEELADLTARLEQSRLVTLTGVGGVGKTRLAVQAAADLAPRFSAGVWLCELATASDDVLMFQTVADAVGARQREGLSMGDSIVEYLAELEVLVVLDNCEHLLTPAARLAGKILQRCPKARMLATSREGLGVPGEHIVALGSLSVPDAFDTSEEPAGSAAVRLFADRATAVRAGFEIDAANADAVVEICRRLDGMPLAIELAAARVTSMSPADIAARLDERFRLLTGGRRSLVERHQTLRATVEWSYSLLESTDRLVFDRLGVFVGGFDAAAAESVVADDQLGSWDVLDSISGLVEKSMVTADNAADGTTRYRMLETLRAFAREQLDTAGDTDRLRRRHALYYAEFCEQAAPELYGTDETTWVRRVDTELDNLWAVLRWGQDAPDQADADLAIRVLSALTVLGLRNYRWELGPWTYSLLGRVRSSTVRGRGRIASWASMWRLVSEDAAEAEQLANEAVQVAYPADPDDLGPAHAALAASVYRRGAVTEALEILAAGHQALDNAQAAAEARSRMPLNAHASVFYVTIGDLAAAQRETEACRAIAAKTGSASLSAVALTYEGRAWFKDDPQRALQAFEEAIALRSPADLNIDIALGGAAQLRAQLGDRSEAIDHLRAAFALDHSWGNRSGIGYTAERAIAILARLGEDELAATCAGIVQTAIVTPVRTIPQVDRTAERVAERLGRDAYQARYERGATLSYNQVAPTLVAALDELSAAADDITEPGSGGEEVGLTERQLEVAQLVARGLTNKDIAERLDVSHYTVETHVRNILERLDATNRTQIGAWVMANAE